ncbi:DUF1329 domain-containing protein [Caballeronia novacaledonica]|uniref:DUF1329 domain-containing protein n=1 Tax=Caballeronia novacaledonica TaxID=1544861 RepID=A0AA37MUN1_9BURK|nr:DUF1329 domain-containing protein [Caballeronia novacaledonica]GJH29384.1 DUF1329 domain-containing protein [Caballeronia novacaledonica]
MTSSTYRARRAHRAQRILTATVAAFAAAAALTFSIGARGAASADEAQQLKSTLTPLGAERAGSKDGVIPAWTGAEVKGGDLQGGRRSDPFASEKPLYTITAQNMAQYVDKLTDGQQALLKKYPDYRIDVYSTHRTGIGPQWVYDATFKNATNAKLEAGNLKVTGAYGGIPFPIPKSGDEAIWNHLLRWAPAGEVEDYNHYAITADGSRVLLASGKLYEQRPYYVKGGADKFDGYYWKGYQVNLAPALRAGEATVGWAAIDRADSVDPAWTYLPGQRRVRKLPVAAYDTPVPATSGFSTFDELNVFLGAPDRYEWKIIGKKELIVPYNVNRALQYKDDQVLGKHFINPDAVRWEVHRVWVVDAQLKPGKRHQIPHKRFYLDEDTWTAVLADGWDANGQLWKSYWQWLVTMSDAPGALATSFGSYDLTTGAYLAETLLGSSRAQYVIPAQGLSNDMFTAEAMAAAGQ